MARLLVIGGGRMGEALVAGLVASGWAPATEIVVLHDADAERSLVILFFDTEDEYRRGDEALNAMPAGDTPGTRTSVTKYEVAFRTTS